jgi:hypothetical protein
MHKSAKSMHVSLCIWASIYLFIPNIELSLKLLITDQTPKLIME